MHAAMGRRSLALRILRGFARALLLAAAAAATGALIVLFSARSEWGRQQVRALLLAELRGHVPGLDMGAVGGDLSRDLVLEQIVIRDRAGRPAIRIARAALRLDLSRLLRQKLRIETLSCRGVRVRAVREPGGALNLSELVRAERAAHPISVEIEHFSIDQASAEVPMAKTSLALRSLRASGSARMDPDGMVELVLDAVAAEGRLAERMGSLEISGRAHLQGWAPAVSKSVAVTLARAALRLEGLPPIEAHGTLSGPLHHARAVLALEAVGTGSAMLDGSIDLGRQPLAYDFEARLHVPRLDGGVGDLALRGRGRGAELEADVRGTLHRLAALPGPVLHLAGTGLLRARIAGTLPGPLRGWAHLDLHDVALGALRFHRLTAEAEGRDLLRNPEGSARLTIAGAHLAGQSAQPGTIVIDLARQGPALRMTANAHALPAGAGASLTAQGLVNFAHGRLASARIELEHVRIAALGESASLRRPALLQWSHRRGLALSPLRLRALGGTVVLGGTMSGGKPEKSEPPIHVRLETHGLDLARLAVLLRALLPGRASAAPAAGTLDLTLAADGPLRSLSGAASVRVHGLAWGSLDRMAGSLDARLDAHEHRLIVSAHAMRGAARLALEGSLPLLERSPLGWRTGAGPLFAAITLDGLDLADLPLRDRRLPVQGIASLRADVSGSGAAPRAHLEMHWENGTIERFHAGHADLVAFVDGDLAHPGGQAELTIRDAQLGPLKDLHAGASLAWRDVLLEATAQASVAGKPVLALQAHANLDLPVFAEVAIRSRSWPDAPFWLVAQVPGLELRRDQPVPGLGTAPLSGLLRGTIRAGGTFGHPTAQARVTLERARLGTIAFARAESTLSYAQQTLGAALAIDQQGGGWLRASFRSASSSPTTPAQLDLQIRRFDLAFLPALFPAIRDASAQLDADARGVPTPAGLGLRGQMELRGGKLAFANLPALEGIDLRLEATPGRLELRRLQLHSGRGALATAGWLRLEGLRPKDLLARLEAIRFPLGARGQRLAWLTGSFDLSGQFAGPSLEAQLTARSGTLELPHTGGRNLQKLGPLADVYFVELAKSAPSAPPPPSRRRVPIALHFLIPGNFGLHSKEIDATLAGALDARSTESGRFAVAGEVQAKGGTVNLFGRRFELERARLQFQQDTALDPALDVRATRRFRDALVTLSLTGTLRAPLLALSSDPPLYNQVELVALVISGNPGAVHEIPSQTLEAATTGAIASVIAAQIREKLAVELPIDVLRIGTRPATPVPGDVTSSTGTRVEVGKYLSDDIYLSYIHQFRAAENDNQNEAHVEYMLTTTWVLETTLGDAGIGGMDVLWTRRY